MAGQAAVGDSLIGLEFGHYRILERVGSGGMGVVYRGYDAHLDREVAIKVLNPGTIADDHSRKRFRNEALALSKLNHPNIATVHDFETHEGRDFLVMEFIQGIKLADRLVEGSLPEKDVIALGIQLAEGLSAAHEHAVVHRDLKPGNLLLNSEGRLKILDFGLAKLRLPAKESPASETLSETHAIAGTLPYMAPEQVLGGEIDARTDIHAAGIVLYEMATGLHPFSAVDRSELISAILRSAPTPASRCNSRLSPELARIIGKCLEREPEDRYQSAKELGIDLRRLQLGTMNDLQPAARLPRWQSAKWVQPAMFIVGAIIVLAVALAVANRHGLVSGGVNTRRIQSLAVLPLANLSGDPQQEYFADGMTEELITNLGKVRALRVISRTSVMQYKQTQKTVPTIAGELNVDAIVEGSVVRSGSRVRITAQLIQAKAERQLWSETYERNVSDILALQSDVAQAITSEVKAKVTPQEQARLANRRPVNPEAYELYLKARYLSSKWPDEEAKKSIIYIQQAIALDPTYAPAYADLADYHSYEALYGLRQLNETVPMARAAVGQALELDETLSEAHAELGEINFTFDWDWTGAEKEFKRAIVFNPNSSRAHLKYSVFLISLGRSGEAVTEAQKALELDPLTVGTNFGLGWVLYYARKHDESIAQLKKTLELAPDLAYPNAVLGWNYAQKRMFPEAVASCQKAVAALPDQVVLGSCGMVYAVARKRQDALTLLSRLKSPPPEMSLDPYNVAILYDGLGETDSAVEWLERAYVGRSGGLSGVKCELWSGPVRNDPRFKDLLRRMNFPQ
jgi:serine/threonine-protein kinase